MAERTPSTSHEPGRPGAARSEPAGPEWKTDRWKHQVEAEARSRLKRRVHDVASHQSPPTHHS